MVTSGCVEMNWSQDMSVFTKMLPHAALGDMGDGIVIQEVFSHQEVEIKL